MVSKIGQRKFLLKRGYFEAELDKMSPSEARRIIANIERVEHPQGQRKVYNEKEINAIKEFVEWLKYEYAREEYFERREAKDCQQKEYAYLYEYHRGKEAMAEKIRNMLDQDLEKFMKERK